MLTGDFEEEGVGFQKGFSFLISQLMVESEYIRREGG